jgi:oxamate amidohydrolase
MGMLDSTRGTRGIAVAPHALASQSALDVLREGGNALEAMVAAAATIPVVYPHMNSLGGDSFWLVHGPGRAVKGIDACGAAAGAATIEWYKARGVSTSIPHRGGLAANTVAGAISGWDAAFKMSRQWGGKLPLKRLLADAVHYADRGIVISASQHAATVGKLAELARQPGFRDTFLRGANTPPAGSLLKQPRLATTLVRLARAGCVDFYDGQIMKSVTRDLAAVGSPLVADDFRRHRARQVTPLALKHTAGTIYNIPPPTQGLVSLLILGILDELGIAGLPHVGADYVHLAVEATKQAFTIRDGHITDPAYMRLKGQNLLAPRRVRELSSKVDRHRAALPVGQGQPLSDTVWLGVIDGRGRAVSMIQSIYHEFGSGVVLEDTGIHWQNRGCSFALEPEALNSLRPGRKPFHTLNPALAVLRDGRVMVYGAMGGDGQPQTQAAVFTRIVNFGMNAQAAVNAPRWVFGRTWGQALNTLRLESRFGDAVFAELARRGHQAERLADYDETVGHAGAVLRQPDGILEGGADPRSDGVVAAF